MAMDLARHPCFRQEARHEYARVHLPVAPKCNVQCNFCNRRFDCMNESRPGVTSTILTPKQAVRYLDRLKNLVDRISVVGIAGPGDPFANPKETLETLRLVREYDPDMLLCVASNGLAIGPHISELAELDVSHVTITINAVDPSIGEQVYSWVIDGKRVLRGRVAAETLLQRQLAAVAELKRHDITVKINCIVMPGVNEHHVTEVAAAVRELGADLLNCMPLCPVEGTPFGVLESPSAELMQSLRADAETFLPQMTHCQRCRADAVGFLGQEMNDAILDCLQDSAHWNGDERPRPYVAVASEEGMLVNLHLGDADEFLIYADEGGVRKRIETREAPRTRGHGMDRWAALAEVLSDCRALLVNAAGDKPRQALREAGVRVVVAEGMIDEAVRDIFAGKSPPAPRVRFRCGEMCAGDGLGCS